MANVPDAQREHGALDTKLAFVLLCLAAIAPLLVVNIPPLVDLYGHLGRYAVQTELHNRPELQKYFSFQWRLIGNLGADLLVQALHSSLGIETATKFVVVVTQLLGSAGILLLSRELHARITPFAVASLPLIYGLPFNYGFLNFSLSMALSLLTFALLLRLNRKDRKLTARVTLAVSGMLIWICHIYGWAFLGLLYGSTSLAHVINAKDRPIRALNRVLIECWPILLPLVPMIAWRSGSGGLDIMGWSAIMKLQWLFSAFRSKWISFDVASLIVVVCLIYWGIRNKAVTFDQRLSIAALLSLATFIVLPVQVFGSMFADMRLVPYVLITALLSLCPRRLDTKTFNMLGLITVAFFAGRMVAVGTAYVEQERAVEAVLPAIDSIPEGARVAFLSTLPCEPTWELPVLSHVGGMALARRKAFVNNQWQASGANLLTVHYPAAAPFDQDPSQYVRVEECENAGGPALSTALKNLPYQAFTHVWIVGPLPDPFVAPHDFELVPHAGKGALFSVRNPL